jgi:uncharacterized RDD family membrane protein YckC
MAETASCPKCGFERRPGAVECPACGIVYARFDPERAAQRRLAASDHAHSGAAAGVDPYRAPMTDVRPFAPATELARRFSRLAAAILDSLIYMAVGFAGFAPVFLFDFAREEPSDETAGVIGMVFLGLMMVGLLAVFIVNLYFLHRDGQTLGKKALKIRIVRTNDDRASLGRIFALRMLVPGVIGAVPIVGPLFTLADVLFIFGEERRCIHDYFADTKVVLA